jgi:hypothetical protein
MIAENFIITLDLGVFTDWLVWFICGGFNLGVWGAIVFINRSKSSNKPEPITYGDIGFGVLALASGAFGSAVLVFITIMAIIVNIPWNKPISGDK